MMISVYYKKKTSLNGYLCDMDTARKHAGAGAATGAGAGAAVVEDTWSRSSTDTSNTLPSTVMRSFFMIMYGMGKSR